MAVKIKDLMTKDVTTAQPHHTVGHIKEKMAKRSVNSIPVVSTDHAAVGVVSASDLIAARKEGTPISNIMADNVYTIPEYEDVSVAARMMRNHKIHHLVVTNEQKVVGIISSFDLLTLVEDRHRVLGSLDVQALMNDAVDENRGGAGRASGNNKPWLL